MKKNVIIFHTDQQRYDSLGCNGNEQAKTPNIDALAKDGCRFTRHIAANPTCMPSRASLLTGLNPSSHGVESNGIPLWRRDDKDAVKGDMLGVKIEDKIPTLADILFENGYDTSLFGKLHLTPHGSDKVYGYAESNDLWNEENPIDDSKSFYGFQTKKMIMGHGESPCAYNGGHYGRWLAQKHPEIIEMLNKGEKILPGSLDDIYLSKIPSKYHNSMWLADEVVNYFEETKNDEKPKFMFVGFPDPHHPFTPPQDIAKEFLDIPLPDFASVDDIIGDKSATSKKAMKAYTFSKDDCTKAYRYTMAEVHLIDKAIGQIIKYLKDNELYDDTIIIFTSDHGDFLGDFDMLRKIDIAFKNLVNVPFIIKGTKGINLPKTCNNPMSNVDVVPTVLKMLDIKPADYIEGIDIFSEKSKNNTPMVTCSSLIGYERNISLFDDTYRYTYFIDSKEEELYNHKKDPKELNNLVNDKSIDVSEICKDFKEKLFEKQIECHAEWFKHYALW